MKIKTHKSTAKRFKKTGAGKLQQTNVGHQHLRHRKTSRMLKNAKGMQNTDKTNKQAINRLAPYL